jgi:ATP-dependent Clp protease protease subunit
MKTWYTMTLNAKKKKATICILDVIGEDFWTGAGVTAKSFKKDLDGLEDDVEEIDVEINSPGGSFFDGLAIYNMLLNHKATVNVFIQGLAASAASTIAMAGDTISMSENAYIMIHNAMSYARGNSKALRKTADQLDQFDKTIANMYSKKTKKDEKELLEMMDAETWMDGKTALEMGFVDEVTEAQKIAACFDFATNFLNTPKDLLPTEVTNNGSGAIIDVYTQELDLIKRRTQK